MTKFEILPFRLKPVFKNYIWGGEKLINFWNKNSVPPLAESWELAAHPDGDNLILNGDLKGLRLSEAVKKFPEIVSSDFDPHNNIFPLMVKLLDSKNILSVQVHPNDKYAEIYENSLGKTELWYIISHEPDAFIYLGFEHEISKKEFEKAILNNSLTDYLKKIYVNNGDTFLIEPGTIHAIGGGILLAEVQQNSNITYRVYDYGRGRELHIKKALDVVKTTPINYDAKKCDKFKTKILQPENNSINFKNPDSFKFILCLEGECEFTNENINLKLELGENLFIPANSGAFKISGSCNLLMAYV